MKNLRVDAFYKEKPVTNLFVALEIDFPANPDFSNDLKFNSNDRPEGTELSRDENNEIEESLDESDFMEISHHKEEDNKSDGWVVVKGEENNKSVQSDGIQGCLKKEALTGENERPNECRRAEAINANRVKVEGIVKEITHQDKEYAEFKSFDMQANNCSVVIKKNDQDCIYTFNPPDDILSKSYLLPDADLILDTQTFELDEINKGETTPDLHMLVLNKPRVSYSGKLLLSVLKISQRKLKSLLTINRSGKHV